MMRRARSVTLAAMGVAAALLLAGCSSASSASGPADDGRVRVTASTNAYGQIASAIGGDAVAVTSLIKRASDDPHEFEASATDQLAVNRAQVIIQNGAGYDPFMQQLLGARPKPAVPVLTAATLAADWPGGGADATPDGFNEHVFYDLATMKTLASRIASDLSQIRPADKSTFSANLQTFTAGIEGLQKQQSALDNAHGGTRIFATEPLPLHLTDGAGLVNVTPDAFSEAVEEGNDVPPSALLQANRLLASGDVKVLIANAQAGGPETTAAIREAKTHDIAVLEWMETLPSGLTYLQWMQQNLDQLKAALG